MTSPALPRRFWTPSEEMMLRKYAVRYPARVIARRFGRTVNAINSRAFKLNISLLKIGEHSPHRRHSDAVVYEVLRRYMAGEKVTDIADALNLPYGTCASWTSGTERAHIYREVMGG